MKIQRRIRLVALTAALAVLLAPLCAAACDSDAPAATATAHSDMPPCHGPEPADEAPASTADCDCDGSLHAAIPSTDNSAPSHATLADAFIAHARTLAAPSRSATRHRPLRETDLPPPKIWLETESLLL